MHIVQEIFEFGTSKKPMHEENKLKKISVPANKN